MKNQSQSLGLGLSIQFDDPSKDVSEKEFFSKVQTDGFTAEFSNLVRLVGFRRALRSLIERYRYIVRLWIVRESAIIRILSHHYEKIPRWSMSRLIVFVYSRSVILRRFLWKRENLLNKNNI